MKAATNKRMMSWGMKIVVVVLGILAFDGFSSTTFCLIVDGAAFVGSSSSWISNSKNLLSQQNQEQHRFFSSARLLQERHPLHTSLSILASASIDSDTTSQHNNQQGQEPGKEATTTIQFQSSSQKKTVITGVSPIDGPLNDAVARVANISLEQANELIQIGAVWAKMEALTEEDLLLQYSNEDDEAYDFGRDGRPSGGSSSSRTLYADLAKNSGGGSMSMNDDDEDDLERYTEAMEQQRFRRILTPSRIEAGTDLRIYTKPRRFTESCNSMTESNILYEDTTFLVVDKPPMLPTQPDASNYYECCPGCVSSRLGPFYDIRGNEIYRPAICHRVDACVGGCVVLSKDTNGQKVFQEFQRDRKIRKVYLAVTEKPPPLGMHIHWMWAPQTVRGKAGGPPCQLLSHIPPESRRKARQFWNRCVLEVVSCEPIQIHNIDDNDDTLNKETTYYQSKIRLVTGRKHQVRAQLSSLGCPIIRDTLYGPVSGLTLDRLGEGDSGSSQDGTAAEDGGGDNDDEDIFDQALSRCRVPTKPIGLQAHAIAFGGILVKAGAPWWAARQ